MSSMSEILMTISMWFDGYVHSFYSDNPKEQQAVVMKEEHTAKVRQYCRELAEHLMLSPHDVILAEIIGLLHDVGRFRQFQKYHTFVDYLSEDHAALGLQVISEQPFVNDFVAEDRLVIFYAIQYHNKKSVQFAPNERALLFAKMLRDADKMDIYRVLEPFLQPPDGNGVSPQFVKNFVEGKQCDYTACRTMDDKKIIRLMWAYDINFGWMLERIARKGYYEVIYRNLPHTPEIAEGMQRLCDYVVQRCAEPDEVNYAAVNAEAARYIVE